ncbi:hypothetical protein [Anaerofustis sp.]|uniref:hypothetical protein n=1 Tax=Anaerofustis sp. TaxID=1872517 RepID=UPI0025BC4825|nr:hypothetical protein [Anaerofustis sp.]
MIDMTDFEELRALEDALKQAINEASKKGCVLAEASRNYKIAANKKMLELRAKGEPVTLITQSIHGFKEVADRRFDRDVADVEYAAAKENINYLKLRIKIKKDIIDREWYFNG